MLERKNLGILPSQMLNAEEQNLLETEREKDRLDTISPYG